MEVALDGSNLSSTDAILAVILDILAAQSIAIGPTTDIFASGLTDSQGFLDIILEVEGRTTVKFNPESVDFDGPMTPLKMARAFK